MENLNSSLIRKEGTVDGQKFIPLLKLELLKDNHEALMALIKQIHRHDYAFSVYASLDDDAKKLFLKIHLELMKEYQVISSESVKCVKGLNDDLVEPYERLCEILIQKLIWAEDVEEIRKQLDYWFPEGLSFSDLDITASDVGSPLMRTNLIDKYLDEQNPEYLLDTDGGSKKWKPGEVGVASEQAFDENGIHERPYYPVIDWSPCPNVGITRNMGSPYGPFVSVPKGLPDANVIPGYYLDNVTSYVASPVEKLLDPPPFAQAVFPDATTIQIKQDLNDPDLEYLLETDGGSNKGKPGKFKCLKAVGLAAGIFIVNMSLADSDFPEHRILIGVFATLPPLLALIKKAFSSNASD